jgi:hypothetical protein
MFTVYRFCFIHVLFDQDIEYDQVIELFPVIEFPRIRLLFIYKFLVRLQYLFTIGWLFTFYVSRQYIFFLFHSKVLFLIV